MPVTGSTDGSRDAGEERVGLHFDRHRSGRAVAGMQPQMWRPQRDTLERGLHRARITEREIGATNGTCEHNIADEDIVVADQRHVSRCVAGQMRNAKCVLTERHHIAFAPFAIRRRCRLDWNPVGPPLHHDAVVENAIGGVQPDRHVRKHASHAGNPADVIEMPVSDPDRIERELCVLHARRKRITLGTGIDYRRALRRVIDDDVRVRLKWADRDRLDA